MSFLFKKSARVSFRLLTLAFSVALSACGGGGSGSAFLPQVDTVVSPPSTIVGDRPQVTSGWLPHYSDFVEAVVASKYPELLDLAASRMAKVCPSWSSLSGAERETFWSSLLWSIAGPESGRNRLAIYRESTLPIDRVTGVQIRSEGLLQLSYSDVVAYKYNGGDISWVADQAMALADYAKAAKLGNPARTILNAYANLNLGLWIMHRLVAIYPTQSLDAAFGHYWSTMRSSGSAFTIVVKNLKSALPVCFR